MKKGEVLLEKRKFVLSQDHPYVVPKISGIRKYDQVYLKIPKVRI